MPLQYVKSKKGRDQLLYKGYLHTKERVFGNKTVWKCASYHRDHCRGRAHTCDDHVIKYSFHHHPPGKPAREAKRTKHSAETATPSGPQLAHNVVLPTSSGLPETVPAKRPCMQNPKQTMQRLRECFGATRQGTCHSQTSATVAKSVPKDPSSSVLSVTPPNLQECSERVKEGSSTDSPVRCEEPKASHSVLLRASQEAGRQRFRSGTIPSEANPQEILSWISEAAQQWLCPQENDKDQIVDLVILEQFLAVLPVSMQAWVKAREPRSSVEAVRLAETYVGDQEPATAGQELEKDLVTFKEVSVHFSEKEWALLDQREKALYWEVMHQNYDNVAWLSRGTGSKRAKDPWQEASESVLEQWKTSNKEISCGVEQDSMRENHLERQLKISSEEKEEASVFIGGLNETTRDSDPGLETVCVCCGCREEEESSSVVASRKCPREEDAEPAVLSGELKESSGEKIPQNPEENIKKEGQKDAERQRSDNSRVEENLIALRDHQDSRPGQETVCMAVDGGDRDESLTLLHDQNITLEDNLECVALPEGFLYMSEEEISQSPEKDSQPEPMHVNSLSELNRTCSREGVNETAALISQKTIVLDREQISSPGKEGGEVKSVLSGNGLPELTEDLLLSCSQPAPEPQPTGPNPEESSEHNGSPKSSQGEDLSEGPSNKRQFVQSSASTTQPTCSDSGGNPSSLPVLIKHRLDKKRKPCSGRNKPVRSVLGTQWRISSGGKLRKYLNWNLWASRKWGCRLPELQMGRRQHRSIDINAQPHETLQTATEEHRTISEAAFSSDTREVNPLQRAPSSSLLDKTAAEPIVAQLMGALEQYWSSTGAVLKQVAADTAEIKSVVSRLDLTMAGIQNALGSLSGCTDDAQHRISDLEFTSQNTKAQLVQHCSDIKAIEAKLQVGKAVQTNVIAGLWPRGVKREMNP